ncbi:8-oxo-dGDP phosphatase NUDT18 [Hemicordylus capensis]|uniref:8-oxo-dGDP phosphatase NUDT18 n=1 Tax=Hemicordylus capensis TaxID=884348 RepID=UPI0023039744|nr:8-oxo-dGDP phosphatase NUDT18 [Hemicordylus capensis]
MMVPEELEAVLSGQGWPVPPQGCDSGPPEPAHLRRNTCYIVLAVLLNEENEVLMMQEAKSECRGRWYLPAGRMEPKETIVEAMQREVQEETGLQCRPLTLLAVEERGPTWVRFAFLAQPTGGTLKTLQEADAESLQARWWDRESPALPLRAQDIVPLMDLALQYRASPAHPPTLPAELPCTPVCQRLLVAFAGRGGALWLLLATAGSPHLPLAASELPPSRRGEGLGAAVQRLLRECLAQPQAALCIRGLLGVQHSGQEPGRSDGVCFNTVATIGGPGGQEAPPELKGQGFVWWKVEEDALRSRILPRLSASSLVPMPS